MLCRALNGATRQNRQIQYKLVKSRLNYSYFQSILYTRDSTFGSVKTA